MAEYKELIADISKYLGDIAKGAPEIDASFSNMVKVASAEGKLDMKTKELIALSLSINSRCDPCIAFHARKTAKLGITREEVIEMMSVCIFMGGGPSYMYCAKALKAFDEFNNK